MSQSNDSLRLGHMLELAREAMEILGDRALDALFADRVLQLALLHLVGVIGEAAAKVTEEGRKTRPGIPWRDVVGMRNRLIHGYDEVDLKVLYDTIRYDLPELVRELDKT
ncbi:MAG: DUF86 domain-containing protein [bacterium]|nr:DUF86 domain-containing protein [bacterium]